MNLPLFVYGSLRSDAPQAALLAGLPRRPATTSGALYRLPAGYPALVPGDDGVVAGELVENASARLVVLDRYEGVSEGLYDRVVIPVRSQGLTIEAWAYTMPRAPDRGGRRIRSGRWQP